MAYAKHVLDPSTLEPPSHLSDRSKALWRFVVPTRIRSLTRLALLEKALQSRDLDDNCQREIEEKGLLSVTESTKALHMNPLLKVQKDARTQFARLWEQLGLSFHMDLDCGNYKIGPDGEVQSG